MSRLSRRLSGRSSAPLALVFALLVVGIAFSMEKLTDRSGSPDDTVSVSAFEPQGSTDPRSNITVTFDGDLVSADSLDRTLLSSPLQFDPPIPGIARWIETNVLRFYPDDPLAPATEYRARLVPMRTYSNGKRIVENRTFTFETPGMQVLEVSHHEAAAEEQPDQVRVYVTLRFNYPVAAEALRQRLRLQGSSNAELGELRWEVLDVSTGQQEPSDSSATGDVVTIRTQPIPQVEGVQMYRLVVEPGLRCAGCREGLATGVERTIVVEPKRRLVVHELRGESRAGESAIRILLSAPVSLEAAREHVDIEQDLDYRVRTRYNMIELTGPFQPGAVYGVTVRAGLQALNGSALERTFSSSVRMSDIKPNITWESRGVFMPRDSSRLLEVRSTNVDTLAVEVEQVFPNNLVYALAGQHLTGNRWGSRDISAVGRPFFEERFPLAHTRNTELTTTIDIGAIIGDTTQGIFKVSVRNVSQRWVTATRLVMLTDIGILARLSDDYLMVWANALTTTGPVAGAEVRLYSKNNQLLLSGTTDSRGIAIFENIGDRLEGFEPYVITVRKGDDLAYLLFEDTRIETSDFDVAGRPYVRSGYEAFVYFDRGVYRPGDTTHIASLVRGKQASVPEDFPYFLTVVDPSGRTFKSFRVQTGETGFQTADLALPEFAATGQYVVRAHIGEDYEIGRGVFQVEEFMPDRIAVEVTTAESAYRAGETMGIEVTGKFLFGPPASNHRVSGHITIEPHRFSVSGRPDYTFEHADIEFVRQEVDLADTSLGADGTFSYEHRIPTNLTPPSALKALISASVFEQGGRAVNGYREVMIHAYPRYVGLKRGFEGYAALDDSTPIRLIVVGTDGSTAGAEKVRVVCERVIYNSVLRQSNQGRYRWVSEKSYQMIESRVVAVADSGKTVSFRPPGHGRFRVTAEDLSGGHAASLTFYVSGRGYAPWSLAEPDRVEIGLDKAEYNPGDQATLQVRAPFGGKLLVTIERLGVLEFMTVEMEGNTAELVLPVKADYFPNVYVTATVIKAAARIEPGSPARAFGIAPLRLSREPKRIPISLSAPEVMRPRQALTVEMDLGVQGETEVTLAAVDAGILQLTGFATPDPLQFFHGQRQPGLRPYDIYSLVYPEIQQAESHLSPAGGRMFAEARKRHLNPISARRVKPVALWSGPVTTDRDGRAAVTFEVPDFNGTLVLMAVAARDDRFGAARREVTVRDEIVLQESFPRFVSPNDVVHGLVSVFNNTGDSAGITVGLELSGPAELESGREITVGLANGSEGTAVFTFRAGNTPGTIGATVRAHSGAIATHTSFELPNRPAQPLTTLHGAGSVTDTTTARFMVPGEFLPGTDRFLLQTSALSAVQYRKNIHYLLTYPYGCIEQTVSRLFPLLYFNELARFVEPDIFGTGGPDYFIAEGILKLSTMMRPDGTFSFWPGGDRTHGWSSVYANHFLLEARRAGYTVDRDMYNAAVSYLEAVARDHTVENNRIPERLYAAYALAGADRLPRKIANELAKVPTGALPVYSRFHLAGALALAGDEAAAFAIIDTIDIHPADFAPETGGNFSSGVRTNAILLDVLSQIDPDNPSAAVLAKSLIEDSRAGRWYTTQENSFALMALGRFFTDRPAADFEGTMTIGDDTTHRFTEADFRLSRKGVTGEEVTIAIDGQGPCWYYWQSSGVPQSNAAREFEAGIRIHREYLDAAGNDLDLERVRPGDQVICHLSAEAVDRVLHHVVINDLLPAGFEIENPRLKTTPRLSWIPKGQGGIDYQDIRDDRLLLFTDLHPKRPMDFYYSLRAVSAGEFKIPPVAAECMYNPVIAGASSSGVLTIRPTEHK